MIDMNEAQSLMKKFIKLRAKANETKSSEDISNFKKHETLCIEKFSYIVTMKTGRYKSFSNYEDLNQEGLEALLKGMKNYNPKKGNAFWWFHRYVETKISRSANLHTTIRYPLKVAAITAPHKETIMPVMIEERHCPDKEFECSESDNAVRNALSSLSNEEKKIIGLAYGFSGDKPMSINKICKKLSISRLNCIKIINNALAIMKDNIKI